MRAEHPKIERWLQSIGPVRVLVVLRGPRVWSFYVLTDRSCAIGFGSGWILRREIGAYTCALRDARPAMGLVECRFLEFGERAGNITAGKNLDGC